MCYLMFGRGAMIPPKEKRQEVEMLGSSGNAATAGTAQGGRGTVTYKNVKENPNLVHLGSHGCFSVYEHRQDLSTDSSVAQRQYFMQQMNIRKRQVLAELNGNAIKMQAGAMQ